MEFKYLSQKEVEALSEYQLEKYLDEKRVHELKVAKEAAENAAREAAQKVIAENAETVKAETATAIEAAVKVVKDEYDSKLEAAEAAMNRAKGAEHEQRGIKSLQDEIEEFLSTPEAEKQLKTVSSTKDAIFNIETKAMFTAAGSVAPQFAPIVSPGHDAFHARNAIRVYPTSADSISYNQFTYDGTKAGIGTVAQGAEKPELGWILTPKKADVKKIAGWVDVSDEFLDDIVGSRAWLSYELPQAFYDAEDLQLFKGNGAGTNFTGLWFQAANQTFPQGSVTAGSNNIDKIMAGITEVRKLKRAASAVYLSPVAWQEIYINKDSQEAYSYPNQIVMGNDNILRIGGIPVYWSNIFADNEGLVGDFARGAAIFQKKAMEVRYFEQNKDNAIKNIVTVRIEAREALPIYYPEAFKKLRFGSTT